MLLLIDVVEHFKLIRYHFKNYLMLYLNTKKIKKSLKSWCNASKYAFIFLNKVCLKHRLIIFLRLKREYVFKFFIKYRKL